MEDKIICTESDLSQCEAQVTYKIIQMTEARFNKIMTLRRRRIDFINLNQPTPRRNKDYSSMKVKSIAWYSNYSKTSSEIIRDWEDLKEQINTFLVSLRMTRNPQCHGEGKDGMETHVITIEPTLYQNPILPIMGDEGNLLLNIKNYRRIWNIFSRLR